MMPTRTVMNRPGLAVPGTPAFFSGAAEAPPAGSIPQVACGPWRCPAARADGMTRKQAQP